ncbi:MAG: hypothetical protein A2075_18210 [Geobacteraceae bacterium GWC2_58_44]|nr:MAG: hypothetical protein A2075_18210 [Geobacteraceae bacterium GWC2_58_44]HBG05457.1 hypothetical protein [Geobacter sp.]
MEITVKSILPCDHCDLPKMGAIVHFFDDHGEYHNSATAEVFIDRRDAPLSELKAEAIRAAVAFLKDATAELPG